MLINLPDPLNFLVRSLTHEFYVQNWSWSKKGGMQKGGLVYWVSKIFWSWSKKREMRKGGWVRKGWVRSSSAPGCEKKFSGASRPHPPKKNPEYAPGCRTSFDPLFLFLQTPPSPPQFQDSDFGFSFGHHLCLTNLFWRFWMRSVRAHTIFHPSFMRDT